MDGTVRLWDDRGKPLGFLSCKKGYPWGLQFDPRTSLLVVAYSDRIRIWDIATQQEVSAAMEGLFRRGRTAQLRREKRSLRGFPEPNI
jgi:WD40 repeat protein